MKYLIENPERILTLLGEHLRLTGISLLLALLIALPLGVLAARIPRLRDVLLGILGVIYTIPSLALLVLLIPFTGLSPNTAIIALVAYAQLVLVRNIVVGLTGVDRALIEAAKGMGMSSGQIFRRVELPLALPLILAGTRIAAVSTVGIATIAAFISAGGLGVLLFEGVRTSNNDKILAGAIAVSAVAIVLNAVLWLAERRAARTAYGVAA